MGTPSMEGLFVKFSTLLWYVYVGCFVIGCSSSPLKYEKAEELKKNKEFEQAVKIETPADGAPETAAAKKTEVPVPIGQQSKSQAPEVVKKKTKTKGSSTSNGQKAPPSSEKSKIETEKKQKVEPSMAKTEEKATETAPEAVPQVSQRQPDIEDSVGFNGRRPTKDPFRIGEEVVHDVNYFKVSAGALRFKVEPFAVVNNRKSYVFAMEIKTSPLFSKFYSVDDRVEVFVDFEDLVPRVFQLHVKETKQLREAKMLFDIDRNVATFWEKKVTPDYGEEEKKQEWEILPFTQNVYSAMFYLRNFQWETGKEYSFRVANDNENLVFSGKAVRREILDTKIGPKKAIVIQPTFYLKGKFKPIGDNFIWVSDDDRKYILRIESKIKIGTLVSEVIAINPGKP